VWGADGLLPTQRCIGQGPAGATGLVLREGVVTEVSLEESALAQQMPEDWVSDLQLTQEQVGNAVPFSAYLMSKNGPIVIDIPKGIPVADPRLRQGEWGHQDEGPQTGI
jgi:hypothetical protein